MIKSRRPKPSISYSVFETVNGNNEYFFAITPQQNRDFEMTQEEILSDYTKIIETLGLSEKTQIFSRIYLSDIANQKNSLLSSKLMETISKGAYSIIEQCPQNGGKVALFSYHIKNPSLKKKVTVLDDHKWSNRLTISGKNYDLSYTANLCEVCPFDSEVQTREILNSYNQVLKDSNCSLLENCIRTWIFVRDIDNHYQGMVKARKDIFRIEGLVPETRFIASTGIEGKSRETSSLVSMDALSMDGLEPGQIVRIEAREYLNPTHEYGVTFERGTRVDFGDRSHLYISGTASIDKYGHTVHIENVSRQTERTLENIKALLNSQKSSIDDLVYIIVYLRNITDKILVESILNKSGFYNKPVITVEGAVCRPEWLVEIEGIAIINNKASWPSFI